MAEPIVTKFRLTTEAATQCAASLSGGSAQQSTTTKVIFFVSIKRFAELVTFILSLTNFKARPPGNR
jgi:hypothetical protein